MKRTRETLLELYDRWAICTDLDLSIHKECMEYFPHKYRYIESTYSYWDDTLSLGVCSPFWWKWAFDFIHAFVDTEDIPRVNLKQLQVDINKFGFYDRLVITNPLDNIDDYINISLANLVIELDKHNVYYVANLNKLEYMLNFTHEELRIIALEDMKRKRIIWEPCTPTAL